MLEHADLVGGLLSDPDAVTLWNVWPRRVSATESALENAKTKLCAVSMFHQKSCREAAANVNRLKHQLLVQKNVVAEWDRVLTLSRWASASGLVEAIGSAKKVTAGGTEPAEAGAMGEKNNRTFVEFEQGIARLHDVTEPNDERLFELIEQSHSIAWNLTVENGNPWMPRLLESLLITQAWNGCLEHVLQRESRVRRLMISAGVQELFNVHERIMNASLVITSNAAEVRLIQDWFGEMAGYAWWLPEDVPSLARRCIGQEAGDCSRIGPTEIVALSSQIAERSRIVEDWVRCIFIGMWNAMPAIGLLFGVELVILCISKRAYMPLQLPPPQLPPPQVPSQLPPQIQDERHLRRKRSLPNNQRLLLRNM
jgi:hypothetical protein